MSLVTKLRRLARLISAPQKFLHHTNEGWLSPGILRWYSGTSWKFRSYANFIKSYLFPPHTHGIHGTRKQIFCFIHSTSTSIRDLESSFRNVNKIDWKKSWDSSSISMKVRKFLYPGDLPTCLCIYKFLYWKIPTDFFRIFILFSKKGS